MSEMPKLQGLNVLVVDDSEITRIMLVNLLEQEGAITTTAETGEVALNCVKEIQFDVILMDLYMPVCDGIEATKRIRALGISCPIIAVTSATESELKTLTEVGFNFVSYKPVELEKVIKIITMFV